MLLRDKVESIDCLFVTFHCKSLTAWNPIHSAEHSSSECPHSIESLKCDQIPTWFTKDNHLRSCIRYANALPAVIIFIRTWNSEIESDRNDFFGVANLVVLVLLLIVNVYLSFIYWIFALLRFPGDISVKTQMIIWYCCVFSSNSSSKNLTQAQKGLLFNTFCATTSNSRHYGIENAIVVVRVLGSSRIVNRTLRQHTYYSLNSHNICIGVPQNNQHNAERWNVLHHQNPAGVTTISSQVPGDMDWCGLSKMTCLQYSLALEVWTTCGAYKITLITTVFREFQ